MTGTTWTRLIGGAAAAIAIVSFAPSAARAQSATGVEYTLEPVHVIAPVTRADTLDQRATALYGSRGKWRQAAYLHQMAASARDASDPRAVQSLVQAANLFYHIGDLSAARTAMTRAAARAESQGDVVRAAIAYVDAGYVALEQRNDDQARALGRKVSILADSPTLAAEQRAAIKARLGYERLASLN